MSDHGTTNRKPVLASLAAEAVGRPTYPSW